MPVSVIFASCKKLGIGEHIVRWQRPKTRPQSMPQLDFEHLPESLEVREVHLLIRQPGFRPTEIILVTTLLDPKRYPKAKLAQLYQIRWLATARQFQTSQNHVEDGDDCRQNPPDSAKGHLGTNAYIQLAAHLNLASSQAFGDLCLEVFRTLHATAV